ncbi:MAG: tetratricopeptide repeat protein [Candidatus Marinimicrobia bacterium]|nr:tetratricopeptide repeat protein [Candidatus Neomarinimicrobiota bacterium]
MLKNNHYSSRKGLLLFITGIFLSVLILMPGSSLYAQQRMDDEVMPKEAGGQQEKVSEPINPTREVKEAAKFFYMQGVKKAKEKDYEGALEDLISAYKLFPDKKIKTQIDKLSSFLDKQTTPDIAEDGESSSAKKAPFIDKVASFLGIKPILLATGEKEAETYYREGLKKAKEKDYEGALEDLISAYKLFPDKKIKIQIDKLTSFLGTKPILFAQEGETLPEESDRSVRPEEKRPNAMKLAGEIFDITESLNSSRRQSEYMARNSDEHIYRKDIRSKSRFENDIRTLEKQLQVEPGNILLKRKLGLLYERKQDWDKAKVIYLDLIQQESYNPDNHFFLGSLYASLGDLDKARYLFEEALNLKPDHQPTLEAMYSYLDDTGDTKKMGKNFLKKSIRQNQSGPIQKMAIIREKLENELYDEAIGLAEAGLEQYPNHSGFLYLKGIGLEQNDEIEQARYSYQGAIQFDPKNQDIHLALANLYYNRGQFLYAALSFNDAVTLNPGDINSRYMQGLSYFNAGEWSRAVSAWESLLHYQKDHRFVKNLLPEAYYILAIEYNRTSEYSRSRYAFDNAMKINPNTDIWLPEALRILGKHYREQAMFRESFTAYQEVIELRPKDSGAYLGLGITYWAIGENMMARGAWEKSLELNPENNEAKGWLIVAQQGS